MVGYIRDPTVKNPVSLPAPSTPSHPTWPQSPIAPPMAGYSLHGMEVSVAPGQSFPPQPPPAGYEHKALPPVPRWHNGEPEAQQAVPSPRPRASVGSIAGGVPAPASTEPHILARRRPPPMARKSASDRVLSPQPRKSANKILQLTGITSPSDVASNNPVGTSPTLHRSSQKIRQLMGLDVGGDGGGGGGGGGTKRHSHRSRDSSSLFTTSPQIGPQPQSRVSSSAYSLESVRQHHQQRQQPAADAGMLRAEYPSLYSDGPQSDWRGPDSAYDHNTLYDDLAADTFAGYGSYGEFGPSGIQGRPGDYEDLGASYDDYALPTTNATTTTSSDGVTVGLDPHASAHVAPLQIEKATKNGASSETASASAPGTLQASEGFGDRDLLDFLNLDDFAASAIYGDNEQMYYADADSQASLSPYFDHDDEGDDADADADDELDVRDLYHATASQLAQAPPDTAAAALYVPPLHPHHHRRRHSSDAKSAKRLSGFSARQMISTARRRGRKSDATDPVPPPAFSSSPPPPPPSSSPPKADGPRSAFDPDTEDEVAGGGGGGGGGDEEESHALSRLFRRGGDPDSPVSDPRRLSSTTSRSDGAPKPALLQRTNEHLQDLVASAARRTAGLLSTREERRRENLRQKIRVITEGRQL